MIRFLAPALLFCTLAQPAAAAPPVTPLWQTEAVFLQPESVLADAPRHRLFVSNIDGTPLEKDGKGFISLLGRNGQVETLRWIDGLNAPKGMALVGDTLYVSDIDVLVEIDVVAGRIKARHEAPGARFLNDVTTDGAGHVYVSDMLTNRIHRLADGRFEVWLESPRLANPNGLTVVGDTLFVGCWGVMEADFSTKVPGHVLAVSLSDKSVTDFGSDAPVGNLDGVEAMADGSLLVSDWLSGGLRRVAPDGQVTLLDPLAQGSADIGFDPASGTVWVPMMKDGVVRALRLSR
ncbi:MAG: hypothetical protein KDH20_12935 [Rhodocyclaceae bacterium]|nr:hypothetical protein [Rhodocyclaceae bacterium]